MSDNKNSKVQELSLRLNKNNTSPLKIRKGNISISGFIEGVYSSGCCDTQNDRDALIALGMAPNNRPSMKYIAGIMLKDSTTPAKKSIKSLEKKEITSVKRKSGAKNIYKINFQES